MPSPGPLPLPTWRANCACPANRRRGLRESLSSRAPAARLVRHDPNLTEVRALSRLLPALALLLLADQAMAQVVTSTRKVITTRQDSTEASLDDLTTPGRWSLSHRWVEDEYALSYGALIADHDERRSYRLCRNDSVSGGADPAPLSVYIDDTVLAGARPYALDAGSCLVTTAERIALRYDGPVPPLSAALEGTFTEIDPLTMTSYGLERISRWVMTWEDSGAPLHDVVLVNDLPGRYQFCIRGGSPSADARRQPAVTVSLRVDGARLRAFDQPVTYAAQTCTNIDGATISVEIAGAAGGLSYFSLSGELFRRTMDYDPE